MNNNINSKKSLKAYNRFFNLKRIESFKDFLFVVPALVFLAIFVYYPIIDLVRISFTDWNLIKDSFKYVQLKNYKWLFEGSGWAVFKQSLFITLKYTFFEVTITIIGGLLLALLFNRESKTFNFMRSSVFMPKYISMATASVVFMWILNPDHGILNALLSNFGVQPINWLGSEKTALYGILILTSWRSVGYAMILYISAMRSVAPEYYEASSLDGANGFQTFRYITLPLMGPTTVFLLTTTLMSAMKIFQSVDVMTSGGPYKSTNVIVYWIYNLAFVDFRVDRAAAVSTVFFLILLALTALVQVISEKTTNYDS